MRLTRQIRLGLAGLAALLLALAPPIFLAGLAAVPAAGQDPEEPEQPVVVEWAPDGQVLLSNNGLLARFDLNSDREELLDDSVITFALSPPAAGEARLAVASLRGLALRAYPDGKKQPAVELPLSDSGAAKTSQRASPANGGAGVYSLAWAPDGATLAAGTVDGHVLLWDVETRELWADLGVEPASAVVRLTFSADGKRLLSAFEDGRGVLWGIEEREVVQQLRSPHPRGDAKPNGTAAMMLSPDGQRVLATRLRGEEAEIVMLDDGGGEAWRRSGYGLEFTPDSEAVLALAPPFRIAALYRASDAQALRTFEPPEGVHILNAVRLSPDGTRLLGEGEDFYGQILIVWDFETARILKTRR